MQKTCEPPGLSHLRVPDFMVLARARVDPSVGEEVRLGYASGAPAGDILDLMGQHLLTAINLGLDDHARRLFAGLREHVRVHPELRDTRRRAATH